jgi:hypothetical protein
VPGSSSWMPFAPQGVKGLDDDDDDFTVYVLQLYLVGYFFDLKLSS